MFRCGSVINPLRSSHLVSFLAMCRILRKIFKPWSSQVSHCNFFNVIALTICRLREILAYLFQEFLSVKYVGVYYGYMRRVHAPCYRRCGTPALLWYPLSDKPGISLQTNQLNFVHALSEKVSTNMNPCLKSTLHSDLFLFILVYKMPWNKIFSEIQKTYCYLQGPYGFCAFVSTFLIHIFW